MALTQFKIEAPPDDSPVELPAGPRICMIGLRGIPNVEGGIEKHVEQLSLNLAREGADVHVFARSRYVREAGCHVWNGVTIHPRWAPKTMRLEALVHTFWAILHAWFLRPDIVHIHAIGPSIFTPFARLLGLRVVVTHHGFDYNREKWTPLDRRVLKLGEWMGMRFANARIAVAEDVALRMKRKYRLPVAFVPNGVAVDPRDADDAVLARFGLAPKRYVACIGRLVPEKRQTDLIAAFASLGLRDVKLAIVGSGDASSDYVRRLSRMAAETPGVVMTGQQTGRDLAGLFTNASLFVLPSSHEGMPIALLEALAFGIPVLASDIDANLALGLHPDSYFPLGDTKALAASIAAGLMDAGRARSAREDMDLIAERYSWESIGAETRAVYDALLAEEERPAVSDSGRRWLR